MQIIKQNEIKDLLNLFHIIKKTNSQSIITSFPFIKINITYDKEEMELIFLDFDLFYISNSLAYSNICIIIHQI